jgi:hypothetical protein
MFCSVGLCSCSQSWAPLNLKKKTCLPLHSIIHAQFNPAVLACFIFFRFQAGPWPAKSEPVYESESVLATASCDVKNIGPQKPRVFWTLWPQAARWFWAIQSCCPLHHSCWLLTFCSARWCSQRHSDVGVPCFCSVVFVLSSLSNPDPVNCKTSCDLCFRISIWKINLNLDFLFMLA